MKIYEKIEKEIKEKIDTGQYKFLDCIESENELKDIYKVSRMTVRQALNNLVNKGYLFRHKGKGTFVSNTKIEKQIYGLPGFTETMKLYNKNVKNEILRFNIIESNDTIASNLILKKGDKVYEIFRLRYADDEPILFERVYIPVNQVKKLTEDIFLGSFYNFLEQQNLHINYGTQRIESIRCPKEMTTYFRCDDGEPVLFVCLTSYLDNGKPLEYVESYYLGSKYVFIQKSLK